MARKKKMYNYEFIDCKKSLPSSVEVKCSKSGEKVRMYHKQLIKLIQNKYRNNWSLFKTSYIKKGNRTDPDASDTEEYSARPEGYRKYLITNYMWVKRTTKLNESEKAAKLEFLDKCYYNRWGEGLEEVISRAEVEA